MTTPDHIPPDPALESPLAAAVEARDRDVMAMVARAVNERNVALAYQPIVPSGRPNYPAFYEGLIRVLDDRGRIIPARNFIGVVETHELGRRLDVLALDFGLEKLSERMDLRLAINMSARSIGYAPWQRLLDDRLRDDPELGERLILEITESSAILMPDVVQAFMAELQNRGVSFAVDSFGAGYTALRHLRELYFDILKIDGQFVRGIRRNPDNQALVRAMVAIGQHFDMVTVAESVEAREDADCLVRLGVECMQGYYFGAPTLRPRWDAAPSEAAAG